MTRDAIRINQSRRRNKCPVLQPTTRYTTTSLPPLGHTKVCREQCWRLKFKKSEKNRKPSNYEIPCWTEGDNVRHNRPSSSWLLHRKFVLIIADDVEVHRFTFHQHFHHYIEMYFDYFYTDSSRIHNNEISRSNVTFF